MPEAPSFTEFLVDTAPGVVIQGYDTGGNGPAVVILHGLAGSAREFFPMAAALPEFRTVLVDLRGHGGSTRLPQDVSREAYVADVVRVIEETVGYPVVLAGQSMGGHTAMLAAAARPDLVAKLVLLEVDAGKGNAEDHTATGEYFGSWPVPFPSREAARAFLGSGTLAEAWAADLEERPGGLWPRFDAGVIVRAMNALAAPRWEEWLRVDAPTLVVYGGNGMFTEPSKDEFVRRGRDVTRVDLPAASHDAHLDSFDAWIAALRNFLLS
jgi:pimeloyl-ACP methyl ester carboxylesterase